MRVGAAADHPDGVLPAVGARECRVVAEDLAMENIEDPCCEGGTRRPAGPHNVLEGHGHPVVGDVLEAHGQVEGLLVEAGLCNVGVPRVDEVLREALVEA
eukprot:scaffold51447_cov57-Phaeocystis_antarctica.AAC.1